MALLAFVPAVTACDVLFGGSEECSEDGDCSGDDICDNGECVECENDRDCDDDEECNDGECERAGNEGEGEGEGGEGEGEGGEGEGEGGEGEGEGGGPCNADTFVSSCSGDIIELCGPETAGGADVVQNINCSNEFYQTGGGPLVDPTITCVEPAAIGTVPGPLRAQCWGEGSGAFCQGTVGLMSQGEDTLLVGCAPGFSCTLGTSGDACAFSPSSCSATGVSCSGDTLIFCAFGGDGFTFEDPIVTDCTLLGGSCLSNGDAAACVIADGGLCSVGGIIAQCDAGLTCVPDPAQPGLGTCTAG
jgi:hypothetical protein